MDAHAMKCRESCATDPFDSHGIRNKIGPVAPTHPGFLA